MLRTVAESMVGRVAIFNLDNFTPLEMLNRGHEEGWVINYLNDPELFYKNKKNTSSCFYASC